MRRRHYNCMRFRCVSLYNPFCRRVVILYAKMSFLFNKFSPKKMPNRKLSMSLSKIYDNSKERQELGMEIGPIKLRIGEQESVFENGDWIPETGPVSAAHKENQRLKKSVQELQDENNLLKIKADILLDMLTQTTAESHLQEKEIERLKRKSDPGRTTMRRSS